VQLLVDMTVIIILKWTNPQTAESVNVIQTFTSTLPPPGNVVDAIKAHDEEAAAQRIVMIAFHASIPRIFVIGPIFKVIAHDVPNGILEVFMIILTEGIELTSCVL
jgi:hypothetical protein